jgi:UDPglucose 6-dehydrogenase
MQVNAQHVHYELSAPKYAWDHPTSAYNSAGQLTAVSCIRDPYEACKGAHAICVLTEWDEFKLYDYKKIYDNMVKPAFVFDGRNILDHQALRDIGFIVYALGKPLDPFIRNT